jgi:hypothetical protein
MGAEHPDDPERFEFVIVIIALGLYVAERCLAFAFLDSRGAGAGAMESLLRQILFGRPPFSIFNVVLGFDLNQGLFGLVQPFNLLAVTIQVVHFLINYGIVRIPFLLLANIIRRRTDQ